MGVGIFIGLVCAVVALACLMIVRDDDREDPEL